MNEVQPASQNQRPSAEAGASGRFLEGWLARAPPELASAVRYGAVPHRFDVALLNSLRDVTADAGAAIPRLERLGLITTTEPGRYTLHATLRELCLRHWQTEQLEAYRQLSARAAEVYLAREPLGEAEQLEVVYHQLGAGDETGLQALSQAFEGAWAARRLGFAERLLQYADEQVPVLGTDIRAWLRYFHARLDLAHGRYTESQEALEPLVSPGVDAGLRAPALMSLAGVFTATRRWTEALARYAEAHDAFRELGDRFRAARALEARGITYLHLASGLGGLYETASAIQPPLVIWFRRFEYFPFLLHRWFSRRIPFLRSLYFGADYQDWIIYRLLLRAIGNLQQAERELSVVPKESGLPVEEVQAGIQIHLADLYHRIGQWTQAERRFRELDGSAPVRADNYRRATLQLARGRAALTRTRLDEARKQLRGACQVFSRYSDHRALAEAARLLGDTEVAADHLPEAMPLYGESVDASLAVDDLLASTHVWSTVRRLRQRPDLPAPVGSQLEALEEKLDRRAYIMRFRGELLEHFRKIARRWAYVFLVVIYLLMSAIYLARLAVITPILAWILPRHASALSFDLAAGVGFLLAILLPAVWLYALFYVVTGWRFVYGLDLGDIAQLETEFVLTIPEGMATRDQDQELSELPWEAVAAYVSANVAIWREPIALLSRFFVLSKAPTLVVDGVARHYASLQQDIRGRLQQARSSASQHLADFSFLGSWWTLVALLLVLGMTAESLFDWLATDSCRSSGIVAMLPRDQSYAYVLTESGYLHVVDLWEVENWQTNTDLPLEGVLPVAKQVSDITVAGDYAYITAGEAGLAVVDVSEPLTPTIASDYDSPGQASGLAVAGPYVYVADGTKGLRVVDVSDPRDPREVGSCSTRGRANDVAVAGHYAYVADGEGGLRVVDIADPHHPVEVGSHSTDGHAAAVAIWSDVFPWRRFGYVVDVQARLHIFDLRDPAAPAPVSTVDLQSLFVPAPAGPAAWLGQANYHYDVVTDRRYIFVAAGPEGFRVLHFDDPAAPRVVGACDSLEQATGVAAGLRYAYVADGSGLWAIDVLNPCESAALGLDQSCALTLEPAKPPYRPRCGTSGEVVRYPRELGAVAQVAAPALIHLPIASTTFGIVFWALLFFFITGVARLLHLRAAQRRLLGTQLVGGRDWPLWIVLMLLVAWMALNVMALIR